MDIDIQAVLTGSVAFITCLLVKLLLDFHLAQWVVKHFSWLPVRNYFRAKPTVISGLWEQKWEAQSTSFSSDIDRHSNVTVKQLGTFCYGEFTSKQVKYCVFGRVEGAFFIGHWYDSKDTLGYFGTFQLRIINNHSLLGRWMGHSNKSHEIKHGEWRWKKVA